MIINFPTENTVGLAGDWHGNSRWAVHAIKKFAEAGVKDILQVGDFGYWPGPKGFQYLSDIQKALRENDLYLVVVPGNHEDWGTLKKYWDRHPDEIFEPVNRIQIVPRGFSFKMNDRWFYTFGGAPSIDFQFRTEGKDWWLDELPTVEERERLYKNAEEHVRKYGTPDVFLAHDVPMVEDYVNHPYPGAIASILSSNPMGWPSIALKYAEFGREILQPFYELMEPKLWVNGHYHVYGMRAHDDGVPSWLSLHMDGQLHNCKILSLEDLSIYSMDL